VDTGDTHCERFWLKTQTNIEKGTKQRRRWEEAGEVEVFIVVVKCFYI